MSEIDTIVLSGGALNGIIMLGSLQYYKDNHLIDNVKNYIGTSVGAIISYLLIIGYTPIELVVYLSTHSEFFEKLKLLNIVSASKGEGAVPFSCIGDELEKMTIDKTGRLFTLNELYTKYNKNLVCVTYNITQSNIEYISKCDIPCLVALKMSSNLPLIFEDFKYSSSYYIDGGIGNNFAISYGEKIGEKVLGICVTYDLSHTMEDKNPINYIYKLVFVPIQQTMRTQIDGKRENTTIVESQISNLSFFDFNITGRERLELFSSGYSKAKSLYI